MGKRSPVSFTFQWQSRDFCTRTQVSVVGVGLEEFLGTVQVEAEGQEDLHIGLLLQQSLVNVVCVLQLADADGIIALPVALGVQWVQNLERNRSEKSHGNEFTLFTQRNCMYNG